MKSSKIPLTIMLGGILIASAIYISTPKKAIVSSDAIDPSLMRPVSVSDHILGNPAAPVVIVEYCDFESEYCNVFHQTLHQIIADQGTNGKVAWVFRQFPLTEIHQHAFILARASECANAAGADTVASNNAFWNFANALYDSQPVDPTDLSPVASRAGISGTAFATCYASTPAAIDERITADRKNALDMGATGTPFSLLLASGKNPVVMDGTYSYDAIRELVTEALRK